MRKEVKAVQLRFEIGEVSVQVTEPRRRPVRRPGPSQIKMYGFCRLFRATGPVLLGKQDYPP